MMNRFLTSLFAASCLTAVGQVPEYVPTEGLVAWYPLDGNGLDAGPSGLNGTEYGSVPTDSRNGEANAAIMLDGESHINLGDSPSLNPEDALTFSAWFKLDAPNTQTGLSTILGRNKTQAGNRYCYSFGVEQAMEGFELRFGLENDANGSSLLDFNVPVPINLNQWHHYAATYASTSGLMKVYLDGMFVSEWNVGPIAVNQILTPTLIGFFRPNGDHSFSGAIDDLGVWNRALLDAEILALFTEQPAVYGCTDSTACNFNTNADVEDGSCHFLCQYCKEGTVWDESIQGCVVANPADINFDGCVQLNDLLDLLSAYGNCSAEESPWQCGDPLEYQGYEYETVQIVEQCWFAENLRADNYRNGDEIVSNLNDSEWEAYTQGASTIYDNDLSNLESYGRLYNSYAVEDIRGLCPQGWKVPSDLDWMALEVEIGMSQEEAESTQLRGTDQGAQLRAEFGWLGDGNESNLLGFSALPGGTRDDDGSFSLIGQNGFWWSSTPVESSLWYRRVDYNDDGIFRWYVINQPDALSIRCIQNAE